ncbi:MAG: MFS transporter [Saprospiraceae bacterium]|nr:MFS transporter [Saprospiraceae bacterium]MCB0623950.1 MFS transporter [Saprospiraceae bacterium]MCB0679444.1 MFS transporter [Saprospiraceae bacterium]
MNASQVLNDKKTINAWAFFDWANSSYALVITVAIFPAYFVSVTDDMLQIGRMHLSNSSLYAYAISAAYLIIAIFSPWLSGIADYGGKKKFFMKFFTVLGSLACMSLFFFKGMSDANTVGQNTAQLLVGTASFILATIGFAGGLVFYNAYLPEIVTEDRYDRVSARGYAYGYIGSVILLLINLTVIMNPGWFGIAQDSFAVRLAFIMVGLWWLGFALIPFRILPPDPRNKPKENLMSKGFEELLKVWRAVRQEANIKSFLLSFFCYSAGVQTVLFLASTFAEKELAFGTAELISIILLLQIVAIGGAYLFATVSGRKGNKFSLATMLIIWMAICLLAFFVEEKWQFYVVAALVGLVMGGIQSLSRSTYSKLIPEKTTDTTSYFSFYDILEKTAVVLGTFSFGLVEQLTGGMRNSILALAAFFLISLLVLTRVKISHSRVRPGTV